jgi:methyl-accepting chemotaxis protein
VRAGKVPEALARTETSGDVGRAREQLLKQIRTISESSRRVADQLFDHAGKIKKEQFRQTLFLGFLALILALAVSWLLVTSIRKPLKELSLAMGRFRRGEGEARSGYASANEFGRISAAFNEMPETLATQNQINDQAAQLAGIMMRESELRSFCHEVLKVMINQTGAQTGAIFLLNQQKNVFECFDSIGLSAEARGSFDASISEGQLGLALASGQMERITDIPSDAELTIKVMGGEVRLRDIVTIPLTSNGTTPAIVSLSSIHKFSENAIRLLTEIETTLNARIHGVLAHWHLQTFAEQLEAQNMQLEEQKRTISAQAGSLAQANAVLEQLNRELAQQKRQLEEVSRLKSAFLSNIRTLDLGKVQFSYCFV